MSAKVNKDAPLAAELGWPARWTMSEEKWGNILYDLQCARNVMGDALRFQHIRLNFVENSIVGRCGYCDEFLGQEKFNECTSCPLFKGGYCCLDDATESVFWELAEELKTEDPDWDKAVTLANKMYMRIQQDNPNQPNQRKGVIVDKLA